MNYRWVLFDADETLFEFHSFLGLSQIMREAELPFSQKDYDTFQSVSKPLWLAYQQGTITAQQLAQRRFDSFIARTPFDGETLNTRLQLAMAQLSPPLDGVPQLLAALHGQVGLGVITNGFDILQRPRLRHNGLEHFFDVVVSSEAVGVAKPNPRIFQAALAQMNGAAAEQVLVVGDSLTSDVFGAQQAGMAACWFNPQGVQNETSICPDFEIRHIGEVAALLGINHDFQ